MTEYKTLRVPADAYEVAKDSKQETETWGEFLRRCSENPPETKEYVDATRGVQLEATEYEKIAREVAEQLR